MKHGYLYAIVLTVEYNMTSQPNRKSAQSAIGRGVRVGKLGLSLTGSYLGYQLQRLFLGNDAKEGKRKAFNRNASRRVREELESLRGGAMKIGQMLSMQTHALPPEAIEELARLQMRAPAMHPSLARAQFKASLGKYPEEIFQRFEPEALAAASLGQVHRAVTKKGQVVAVKIQYPAIRSAIENDFKLLRTAAFAGKLAGYVPESALAELEAGIMRETDYIQEADNIDFFRAKLSPLAYVTVPTVVREFTTARVLTMSFIDGSSLDDFLAAKPPAELRDRVGHRLGELFHFQMRRLHALHSDPHPGNYLFDKSGNIGLIDFGSVCYFTPGMKELVRCLTDRVWEQGDTGLALMERIIVGEKAPTSPRRLRDAVKKVIVFYNMIFPGGSVDFGDGKALATLTSLWREFVQNKLVNPDLIFSSRAELGLYNLLHRLGARVDTTAIMEHVTAMKSDAPV
jgi:predicted unusual protein kinase regulating ubiquinone biosynthesis (AarF/ABC1/UbiB family)